MGLAEVQVGSICIEGELFDQMIPLARPYLEGKVFKYIKECIKTRWISSLGKFVVKFEDGFSKFCNTRYGISVCNGTAALHLALKIIGITKGDEVIVPDLTFVAGANTVTYLGAKPIFVDSEMLTWNIDPQKIEDEITSKTRAIIVVHLYGHPAQMTEISNIAKRHNLFIVEDACEAHGALYRGKKVGSIGHLGVFSFYGNKIITTGEGGMIVTNSKKLNDRARFLRDHAMSKHRRYFHTEIGFNYRLTNIQAAIGLAQLDKINYIIKKKIEIASLYNTLLKDVDGVILPPKQDWAKNVYWMYSILMHKVSRGKLIKRLSGYGIETRPFFIPMHRLPPFRINESFPVSDHLSKCGINLPCFVGIKEREIEFICDKIKEILVRG